MRKPALLVLTVLLSAPAFAWVPKLEETTARNVIDGAYGRRDPVPTYQTIDLNVKDGKFVAGEGAVKAFDGGDKCLADWLAAPTDFTKGSRPAGVTVSGQADQLYFQAQDARDNFRNLSAQDALGADLAGKRMTDGLLRVDVNVRGLPSEKARDAYLVRLKAPDGKLIAPVRKSYVNDFKQDGATWTGTLVYYFEPLKAGIGASDKVDLLLRTEADTNCAYSVGLDLGSFQ
ncbi:hypothetical protein E5F05_09100 [Deinococcus metallilatus]|uniref:Uncharacterized protein n=1 Tax=Deinococcus metallilatus TaxID=1211322 RepID=A0AAJ5F1P6_9DEIO|nr:hypothetical protein [Deinococcus metallilatus]MBB5295379.1 hypothetical protein [Deinococcus metallilatus]QBY08091.1 hypothetical protein E5F05_09100 [Deinococcus metallilatus]RXJ12426.1 hypothetical protein ERJ73_07925 [Deinococcus metallilatus]TLK21091.1 hypothetical protein FCS05_19610 [Deinococcus metallilatus]GMA16056.1 hypothetical protein GCM10025871_23870 [Deinococcus metallilatus]